MTSSCHCVENSTYRINESRDIVVDVQHYHTYNTSGGSNCSWGTQPSEVSRNHSQLQKQVNNPQCTYHLQNVQIPNVGHNNYMQWDIHRN